MQDRSVSRKSRNKLAGDAVSYALAVSSRPSAMAVDSPKNLRAEGDTASSEGTVLRIRHSPPHSLADGG
jgi:hypothetical protein